MQWFDKQPTRLPEALMFTFRTDGAEQYRLHKIDQYIDPADVITNGSQRQHGQFRKNKLVIPTRRQMLNFQLCLTGSCGFAIVCIGCLM